MIIVTRSVGLLLNGATTKNIYIYIYIKGFCDHVTATKVVYITKYKIIDNYNALKMNVMMQST